MWKTRAPDACRSQGPSQLARCPYVRVHHLTERIQTRGGAPLWALRMNHVPCGDTKPHVLPNFDPTIHLVVRNPRIKSEPVLMGAIAWFICWKLRLTALPRFTQPLLLCPGSTDGSDHGDHAEIVSDLERAFSRRADVSLKAFEREHSKRAVLGRTRECSGIATPLIYRRPPLGPEHRPARG